MGRSPLLSIPRSGTEYTVLSTGAAARAEKKFHHLITSTTHHSPLTTHHSPLTQPVNSAIWDGQSTPSDPLPGFLAIFRSRPCLPSPVGPGRRWAPAGL